jgi:polyisoprenoid-binding protein YceI
MLLARWRAEGLQPGRLSFESRGPLGSAISVAAMARYLLKVEKYRASSVVCSRDGTGLLACGGLSCDLKQSRSQASRASVRLVAKEDHIVFEMKHRLIIGVLLLSSTAGYHRLGVVSARALEEVPSQTSALVRLDVVEGTTANYRVREQLAGVDFPNDAVGTTQGVEGRLALGPDNSVQTDQSKVTVDLTTLKSDRDRRDNYLRRRTLETERFPRAVFVPKRVQALPSPMPGSGEARFQLLGDMTIKDVTAEVTWDVTASFSSSEITGKAATKFTFDKFGLTKPRVMSVLSVDDEIKLELNFRLKKSAN